MEKQNKVFGTLTVIDKLFEPRVEGIREHPIRSIESVNDSFVVVKYGTHGFNKLSCDKRKTSGIGEYKANLFVNRAKAEKEREDLINKRYDYLAKKADEAWDVLNKFINEHYKL